MIMGHTIALIMLIAVDFLGVSSAATHTLQYVTVVKPGNCSTTGEVDGQQFVYYSSNDTEVTPKTEWIQKINAVEPDYFKRGHEIYNTYRCELSGTRSGSIHLRYDGRDFIHLDLRTLTWTADDRKAEDFIKQWESAGDEAEYWKNYLNNTCIEWLKHLVDMKVGPTASVFQNHSSSPEVVCRATVFFPEAVNITWQKDGEDVHEDVELRETLPNQDGSFQKRSILTVSAEDLQKHTYTCVIQHSSLEKEMVLREEDIRILNPGGGSGGGWIVGVVMALAVLIVVGGGIVCWQKKNSVFTRVPDSDSERPSEVTSDLLVRGVTTASLPSQIHSESVIKIFNVYYNKLTTKLIK